MARYEGMEDLLQRVRERLVSTEERDGAPTTTDATTEESTESYAEILEALLLVRRDTQHAHDLLMHKSLKLIPQDQQEDLQSILGSVLREMWHCKAALERAHPQRPD